jgi:tetratricopeptide (TPR) repeat protein
LAVLAAIAAERFLQQRVVVAAPTPLDPATLRPGFGPATFAAALARVNNAVEGKRALTEANADDWLPAESYARALMARFRLTAEPDDFAEADRQLTRAINLAPWPAGPSMTRASVSLTMHDLPGAEAALARFDAQVIPGPGDEQMEARSLRCEIAFERGQLAKARQLCSTGGQPGLGLRQANIAAKTGDAATAARLIEGQLRKKSLPPSSVAMLALQRASLALVTGDWQASRRWAEAADRVFPGYWLSRAYLAQQEALEGRPEVARQRYLALAGTGNPDVLDALARLALASGNRAEEAQWAQKAGAEWRRRAAMLPLAYAAHRSEHELFYGDPQLAVTLGAGDHARRPFPAAIVHYAQALVRTGQMAQALAVVRQGEQRGFLTAEMKWLEYEALVAMHRQVEADAALRAARSLNPHIDDPRRKFVAFEQD